MANSFRLSITSAILQSVIVVLSILTIGKAAEPTGPRSDCAPSVAYQPACDTDKGLAGSDIKAMSSPPTERAFVMLKPDAVQRGLVSTIVDRLERKGFQLVAMKMVQADRNTLEQHYQGWASTVTLVKVAKEFCTHDGILLKFKHISVLNGIFDD
jgi:hypothetical protein